MSLSVGSRIASYEIVALLGAGGMGEVYRARDPRLGRDVAIKVLPAGLAADPERLGRFEQEARAAAALNHPNILAVHDVGQHDGVPYLVTELLEGDTLRERMARGPLAVRKAIEYAVQIAKGLAAAHDRGIVHRDVKPENVFITSDERVKILDFGLAKLTQPDPVFAAASAMLTTPQQTLPGIVLGTVGYMAPEQVRGLPADHRSDLFALGAVLHEMLSGRRAFTGDTPMDAMTAILKEDPPDLPMVESHIPLALARIVSRCLEKAPGARFKSADDLAFALEGLATHSEPVAALTGRVPTPRRERLAWVTTAVLVAAVAVLGLMLFQARGAPQREAPEMRLDIGLPPGAGLTAFALSPDGTKLVFLARGQLWLRPLGSDAAQPLSATEGTNQGAFWSPDSKSIGFFSDGQLKRIDLGTGLVRVLASAPTPIWGTWNDEGTILFVPSPSTPLMRVGAGGQGLAQVTRLTPPRQISHRFPRFLPDGRRFLFFSLGPLESRGVYVGSLDSPETHRLLETDSPADFVPPDSVLFMRDGALLAQRLNLDTLQMEGDAAPVAARVAVAGFSSVAVSGSTSGSIAYRAHAGERQSFWLDRSGRQIGILGGPDGAQPATPQLSRDDRLLALQRTVNGNVDIWVTDVERGGERRFTFEPVRDRTPVWSPDAHRVAFASERTGVFDIYERPFDGPGTETLLVASSDAKLVYDWSPDGRFVLYGVQDPKTGRDLWVVPVTGDRTPVLVAGTPFAEQGGRFSVDGRWIAYESNESGRTEIYVQPFPGSGTRIQMSTQGGQAPQWRRDGRELTYLAPDNRVMALPIEVTGSTVKPGTPVKLFTAPPGGFVMSSDGQRFLVSTVTAEPAPITLLLNWAGLRTRTN